LTIVRGEVKATQTVLVMGGFNQTGYTTYSAGQIFGLYIFNLGFGLASVMDTEWTSLTPVEIRLYH
jgi:hypothetical protein